MSKCECKNCIHEKVCRIRTYPSQYGLTGDACDHYKDKSLFVELPCKVGDTAYCIITRAKYIQGHKVVGFHLGDFPTLRGHKRKEYLVCYSNYTLYHLDIEQIGKTIFFTKEEAEQKLKELENGK